MNIQRIKFLSGFQEGYRERIYRYFDDLSRAEALRKAFEDEDKLISEVKAIIAKLPQDQQHKVVIANYDDICTPKHMRQKELFFREFSRQADFYNAVMKVVEEVTLARGRTYNKGRGESLAIYVLNELPLFVDGVQKNGDSTIYTAVPYPGFGKIAELEMDIIDGKKFPNLTERLQLSNKVGILNIDVK